MPRPSQQVVSLCEQKECDAFLGCIETILGAHPRRIVYEEITGDNGVIIYLTDIETERTLGLNLDTVLEDEGIMMHGIRHIQEFQGMFQRTAQQLPHEIVGMTQEAYDAMMGGQDATRHQAPAPQDATRHQAPAPQDATRHKAPAPANNFNPMFALFAVTRLLGIGAYHHGGHNGDDGSC